VHLRRLDGDLKWFPQPVGGIGRPGGLAIFGALWVYLNLRRQGSIAPLLVSALRKCDWACFLREITIDGAKFVLVMGSRLAL
jgi:hypothetical protein